ncbi:MAG TPA: molybdenum cofactor guanylyltransferase [Bacteroidetes bacterium]|nr:putative molybdenum cofactor guanylyltransferase [bacterium BMS3Bbin04]HDO64980.1 molybdenum cofactor guanylyltransferase [Bacteroidota bacterium]HEX04105.1 molybdenum cofactor guanylyltransferase [Bacteroidota bacterium]
MSLLTADQITPFIIAGGKSSRFGSDKRLLEVHGRPLLANLSVLVRAALYKNPIFVGDNPVDIELHDSQWIADAQKGAGPLGGLVSALRYAQTDWALILAVDLPGLALADLWVLLTAEPEDAEMIGLGIDDRPEQLIALYRTSTLPIWEKQLSSGEYALRSGLSQLVTKTVRPASGRQALLNLNRPEDYPRLRKRVRTPDLDSRSSIQES